MPDSPERTDQALRDRFNPLSPRTSLLANEKSCGVSAGRFQRRAWGSQIADCGFCGRFTAINTSVNL
jgi:hypothetical protein